MANHLPELLTPEQVADYLQLSVDEVMELLNSREMPGSFIAGRWRIRKGKLDEWIDDQSSRTTLSQINAIAETDLQTSQNVSIAEVSVSTADIKPEFLAPELIEPSPQVAQSNPFNSLKEKPKLPKVQPSREAAKELKGTVTKFDPKAGYGFIQGDDGRTFYVSVVDVSGWGQSLRRNDKVEFEAVKVPQGWTAKKVVSLSNTFSSNTPVGIKTSSQQISGRTLELYQEALVAKEQKDFDRARRLFEDAIKSGQSLNVFQAYAAMEEKETKRVDSALKVLERGIQVFPEIGALYNDKAMLLKKRGKLEEAAEVLKKGLESAPAFSKQLHWSLAQILIELGDAGNSLSLDQANTHAEAAKKLGMPLEDDPRYKKLRLAQEYDIGRQALTFFREAGIETRVEVLNNEYADVLITSQHLEFTETHDLKERILARCFFKKVQKFDLDEILKVLRKPPSKYRGLNSEIGFIILDDSSLWKDVLYRIVSESREVIVPIDKSVFDQSKTEDVIALLRQLLDQWLSRRNLFESNAPVSGRRFFGRETELQNLMRNIDDGQHTGIYGLRKVGKTSLMYQLQEKRPQDLVVYVDLQQVVGTGNHDCAYVYWSISKQLQDVLDAKKKDASFEKQVTLKLGSKKNYSELHKPEKRNASFFDEDISRVMDVLSTCENATGEIAERKIVITIDELEYMLPITNSHSGFHGYAEFFAHLRGIAQKTKGRLVSIVAAANPMISEQATWEGRDNPVFQFYKDTFLPPLTRLECNEMLEKLGRGMSVSFDEASLECIYNETGGHPYITRQLCSHITSQDQSRPLRVTRNLIIDNLDTFLRDKSDVFREILERLDYFPQERDLLLFITEGLSEQTELATLVTEPIDIALRHLIGYQIVDYHDGKYEIKINLLKRWLQK